MFACYVTIMSKEKVKVLEASGIDKVLQYPIFKQGVFNLLVESQLLDSESVVSDDWLKFWIKSNNTINVYSNFTIYI